MKGRLWKTVTVVALAALLLGALAPLALAQDEERGRREIPPELEEYQGKLQEALSGLKEPVERIRALKEELKEGRKEARSLLKEKGKEAVQSFKSDLLSLAEEYHEAFSQLREVRSDIAGIRGVRRQVARAVRAGDTDKAIQLIEDALAKIEQINSSLNQVAEQLEALRDQQAELIEKIRNFTPSGEEEQPDILEEQLFNT